MFIGDAAFRPELIVEYTAVPAPGAIALLGIGGLLRSRRRTS
jgi:MYXO-CTERM domain-containing protein